MKQIIILLLLITLAGCAEQDPQPVPTYVIKVWASDDAERAARIHINNLVGKWTFDGTTPRTMPFHSDEELNLIVVSPDGQALDGELRFEFDGRSELIGTYERGQKLEFTAPARSE